MPKRRVGGQPSGHDVNANIINNITDHTVAMEVAEKFEAKMRLHKGVDKGQCW
jgi:hypothetical protein